MASDAFEPTREPVKQQTSGMALASFICGLASMCLCILTGLPAVILGVMGISRIERSGGMLTGRGLATAGIVLGAIGRAVGQSA